MSVIQEISSNLKKLPTMNNITKKRETIAKSIKINYAKKKIVQKFMDCLWPKAFNSLNLNDQKISKN